MLPQLRAVLIAVTLLLVIWGLNAITIIYTITRGGPANRTLITPIQIFRYAFELFQFNQAAALSVLFFAVTVVIVAIYIKVFRDPRAERGGAEPVAGRRGITILISGVVLVFVCLFPFLWMALSSIKTLRELYTVPPVWFPESPDARQLHEGALRFEHPALFPQPLHHLARLDGDRARPRDLRLLRLRPLRLSRQSRPAGVHPGRPAPADGGDHRAAVHHAPRASTW